MTASALRSLQRQRRLPATGTLTPATQTALGRLGRPFFGQRVIKRGMVGWDVSVLQFLLATYGFDVGTLDGRFGPQTQSALDRLPGAAASGYGRDLRPGHPRPPLPHPRLQVPASPAVALEGRRAGRSDSSRRGPRRTLRPRS